MPSRSEREYRSIDDAVRDGWLLIIGPGGGWWGEQYGLRYHLTAKKEQYNVELAGNSLAKLRAAVRMLKDVPRDDIPLGRGWWMEARRAR